MKETLKKVRVIVWGKVPEDPKEAKLLVKTDIFILTFSCFLYWVNYLDRLNISNAYVSGMKEDLSMHGNEFNLINTCFSIGYILFLIPHNLMLLRVKPKYWLSFCGFAWGILTLSIYKATSYKQICVIRFFQAAFESSTFTGIQLVLSLWYKDEELGLRTAFFTSSGLIGSIFSGILQSAIYTNLHDLNGLAGWRWLFIIDFLITLPIVAFGLILWPDFNSKKNLFFSEDEMILARSRLKPKPKPQFDFSIFKRVVGNWHWWLFSFLWAMAGENESFATNSLFSIWLQYYNYTVPHRNHYPMGIYAIGIFATIACAFYCDFTGARYQWRAGIFTCVIMLIAAILLLSNPYNDSVMFAAQYLGGFAYAGQTIFFSWANIVCFNDLEQRAVVLASMNMFSNAVNAWWLLLFYAADTAPTFRKGGYAMIATSIVTALTCCAIRYLQLRDERAIEHDQESDLVSRESITVEAKNLE